MINARQEWSHLGKMSLMNNTLYQHVCSFEVTSVFNQCRNSVIVTCLCVCVCVCDDAFTAQLSFLTVIYLYFFIIVAFLIS